jgi:hypothetical protein
MVMDEQVNLTLGFFATTAMRDLVMTSSYSYYTSSLIWVIPPGSLISSLEKLLKPFQTAVWTFFLLILFFSFLVVGALKFKFTKNSQHFVFGRKVHDPSLNILNIILGGSLPSVPTRNFARTVLAVFMIYCFVIQNSYKGSLFQFMQMTMREPEKKSTDELIQNNFKFYMLSSSRGLLSAQPKVLEKSFFVQPLEFGKMFGEVVNPEFKGALLTSEDHLAYRNIQASPNVFFRHATESIMTYNIAIYMHKQSCLSYQFNQMIVNLVSAGLVQNWASKYIDKSFLKRKSVSKAVGLNMPQLLGAFQLLVTGLVISFFVFILETFSVRLKQQRNKIPFTT